MARKPPTARPSAKLRRMAEHLRVLGLSTPSAYEAWCQAHGFPATTEKTAAELVEEVEFHQRQKKSLADQARLHRNPRRLIQAACAGSIDIEAIVRPDWQRFCRRIATSNPKPERRAELEALLLFVHDKAKFLTEAVHHDQRIYHYVDALVRLNDRRGQWIRPLETWRPQSHNPGRQFASLLRHLLARFTVPTFMDVCWLAQDRTARFHRDWYLHIASGNNIRTAKTPFPMTKKMAHHFLEAPEHYSIEAALRWGQVMALGGDRRLVEALLGARTLQSFDNHEFWTTVIQFFIANPMLDRAHVAPLVDFIEAQKFRVEQRVIGPGQVQSVPPPQPGFSMSRRTPDTLLAQMEQWHGRLRKTRSVEQRWFSPTGIAGYQRKSGKAEEVRIWRIRELLSVADLVDEGRDMHHCVATYASSCARGYCSIWSMQLETTAGVAKRQTIEVRSDGTVVQCRGRANALPNAAEFNVLQEWATSAGLRLSPYLQRG